MSTIEKVDTLELAVDLKLEAVRKEMFEGWSTGSDNVEFVAALMRAAYAYGVTDTFLDREGMLEWARDLGFNLEQLRR